MPQDVWQVLTASLSELRKELATLNKEYTEGMRLIWIKLTELDVTLKNKVDASKSVKDDLKWLIPTILSILSLTLLYLYKSR